MIRILIAAPFPALRAGLRQMLDDNEEIEVLGESAILPHPTAVQEEIDVVIAAGFDWDELKGDLAFYPPLLLLSDHPHGVQFISAAPPRAWGILPLDASASECLAAVRALGEGLVAGAPHLLAPLLKASAHLPDETGLIEPLTARENQVLQLIAQGLANKQVAGVLGISEHTVKFHISSIYSKLGAANRAEAVMIGLHKGLISL
jgi:DNA-binding NarL/FixJ family response regulator